SECVKKRHSSNYTEWLFSPLPIICYPSGQYRYNSYWDITAPGQEYIHPFHRPVQVLMDDYFQKTYSMLPASLAGFAKHWKRFQALQSEPVFSEPSDN